MPFEFKFPDVGEGITEGTIVKWKVKEGDEVKADQVLAEVETDKAVVEIPSPKKGTILKLYHKAGEVINVGEIIVILGEKGEKTEAKKEKKKAPKKVEAYTGSVVGFLEEAPEEKEEKQSIKKPVKESGKKILAAPSVRKLAQNLKVDLMQVSGTGSSGRITQDDVIKADGGETKPKAKVVKKYDFFGYISRVPLKGIRKITAGRMLEAVANCALVTHHDYVDVTLLSEVRKKEKEKAAKKGVHLTYLPFIIKATIEALKKHPYVASSVEGNEIVIKKYYNIGVAIDTDEGLIVPVIKGADQKK